MTKAERHLLLTIARIVMEIAFWGATTSRKGHEIDAALKAVGGKQ